MPPPSNAQAAQERLTEHRLAALEQTATGARQVERDTDHLKIVVSHIETTIAEFKAEVRERDEHTRSSLARLHERLDELVTDDARADGVRTARAQTWKILGFATASSAGITSAIVGLLALILHH
jgi:hypothetical protein